MSTTETVQAWATTNAGNANSDAAISSSDSQSPGTLDDNIRSIMTAVKKYARDIGGALTAGGTANALTVTTNQVLESGQLTGGLGIVVKAASTNTSTSVTFAPDGLTAAAIKRADGSVLAVGSIQAGMLLLLMYNSGTSEWWVANIPPIAVATPTYANTGQLFGLTLSNDSGGTTAIAVAAGSARDSTDVDTMVLASALTGKVLANSWTVGNAGGFLDTGAVANTTYHVYLIKRPDTGVVDAIASTSASAPTLPSNYTLYRRIGSIIRSGGAIVLFSQIGDEFLRLTQSNDALSATVTSTASLQACGVPTGIQVGALILANHVSNALVLITSPDQADSSVLSTNLTLGATTSVGQSFYGVVRTNTSGQVRLRSAVTSSTTYSQYTRGWIDTRGRV
jgi:hypothetical protein